MEKQESVWLTAAIAPNRFDNGGTLYREIFNYRLSAFGRVVWNCRYKYYLLKPNPYFLRVIETLMEDENDERSLLLWSHAADRIRRLTQTFPAGICINDPEDPEHKLLVSFPHGIGYSMFM